MTYPGQFPNQPGFNGIPLVSFSRWTSFTVASLGFGVLPYHTVIFEDERPLIVMASLVTTDPQHPDQASLTFSFFNQVMTIPNFESMNILISNEKFLFTDIWIWNPAIISLTAPGLERVPFIQNPIVSPWIVAQPPGSSTFQSCVTHALVSISGSYRIGILFNRIGPGADGYVASELEHFSFPRLPNGTLPDLTIAEFLVTSWDAITVWPNGSNGMHTTILLYGLNHQSGTYVLYAYQAIFVLSGRALVQDVNPGEDPKILVPILVDLPFNLVTRNTHCRLSRALLQPVEPLLIMTFFAEVAEGLLVNAMSIQSFGDNFSVNTNQCAASTTLGGVSSLKFVTSVTGGYNYGSFVIWCTTAQTRSAFLTVQVNGACVAAGPSKSFISAIIYSAIYWRRLTSEDPTLDKYQLYPVGGGSLPFLLATDIPLEFNGEPAL